MADAYGSLTLPVSVPVATVPISSARALAFTNEAVGDPFLGLLLRYAQSVLVAYCGDAWKAIAPGDASIVRDVFPWNPERDGFSDAVLPALYGYRIAGKAPEREADDWRTGTDQIALVWALPLQEREKAQIRNSIVNALAKALDAALFATRDPSFVASDDPDPAAPSYDAEPAGVKFAVATTTGAVTYGGAALDGARGGGPYAIPRGVTVTLGGAPSSFVHGSTIRVTGTNVLGAATTVTLTVDTSQIPGALYTPQAFWSVTQVQRDAQAGASGTLSVGLQARRGEGTELCRHGVADMALVRAATWRPLKIPLASGGVKPYAAVEFLVAVTEKRNVDLTRFPVAGLGIDAFGAPAQGTENTTLITNPEGVVLASANFP